MRKPLLSVWDFFDLEYFLYQDHAQQPEMLDQRDADIFRAYRADHPQALEGDEDHARLMHYWLQQRRVEARELHNHEAVMRTRNRGWMGGGGIDGYRLPGERMRTIYYGVVVFCCALLFLLAASYMGHILNMSRTSSVNIMFPPFTVFVGVPVGLFLLLLLGALLTRVLDVEVSPFRLLFRRVLPWLAQRSQRAHDMVAARVEVGLTQSPVWLAVLRPYLVVTASWMALCYAAGAWLTLQLGLLFMSTHVGWESTSLTPQQFHGVLQWLGWWHGMVPDSLPSVSTMVASRITDPRILVPVGDVWWHYLEGAIIGWVVVPRLLAAMVAGWMHHRRLETFDFNYGPFQPLLWRLQDSFRIRHDACDGGADLVAVPELPGVTASGVDLAEPVPVPASVPASPVADGGGYHRVRDGIILLVPERIYSAEVNYAARIPGPRLPLAEVHPVPANPAAFLEIIRKIAAVPRPWGHSPLVLLQPAYRPGTEEDRRRIVSAREILGRQPALLVWLVGRPTPDDTLTPPKAEDQAGWREVLLMLDDPQTRLLS